MYVHILLGHFSEKDSIESKKTQVSDVKYLNNNQIFIRIFVMQKN